MNTGRAIQGEGVRVASLGRRGSDPGGLGMASGAASAVPAFGCW